MANAACRDEILFCVLPRMAAEPLMVHFEVSHGSAVLAAPTIPPQDGMSKLVVLLLFQANWRLLIDPH
jgi:hypothetical protein